MRGRASRRLGRRFLLALAGGLALLAAPVGAAPDRDVLITTTLDPAVAKVVVEERVNFVNRSGGPAHIEFVGRAGEHHVVEVPWRIWAVFHRPGPHRYEVHLQRGRDVVTLEGTVEVSDDASMAASPPVCDGVTVMGVCLER